MNILRPDPPHPNLADPLARHAAGRSDAAPELPRRTGEATAPPGIYVEMMRDLASPFRSTAWAQRTVELHAQFRLKGTFQADDGSTLSLDLAVKVDFKAEYAVGAYAKTADPATAEDHFSPEKTAARIVDFAKGFLGAYRANHEGEATDDVLANFFDLARAAIEKGFGEAREALGAAYGEPAEKTRTLVGQLLDAAERELRGAGEPAGEA